MKYLVYIERDVDLGVVYKDSENPDDYLYSIFTSCISRIPMPYRPTNINEILSGLLLREHVYPTGYPPLAMPHTYAYRGDYLGVSYVAILTKPIAWPGAYGKSIRFIHLDINHINKSISYRAHNASLCSVCRASLKYENNSDFFVTILREELQDYPYFSIIE